MVNDLTYVKHWCSFETIGAFLLRWKRHRYTYDGIRQPIERMFMNYIRRRYMNFDPHKSLFKKISIGVVSTCPGKCKFCPSPYLKRPYHHIETGLLASIIGQLKSLNYDGEIGLNLQSDAFAAPDAARMITYTARNCPNACVFLSTNGIGLTQKKYHAVMEYPNVKMLVDDYKDGGPKIREIKSWDRTKSEKKRTYLVNKREPHSIINVAYFKSNMRLPLKQFCVAPFTQLCIGPYGEGVMCCLDWERYYDDVGDANNQSLKEIWSGERLQEARKQLLNNKRKGLCAQCDMMGHRWSLK